MKLNQKLDVRDVQVGQWTETDAVDQPVGAESVRRARRMDQDLGDSGLVQQWLRQGIAAPDR